MTPIDLIPFAENSQKVPKKFLAPVAGVSGKPDTLKLLCAHFMDFWTAFMMVTLISGVFSQSVKSFLVTKGLQSSYSSIETQGLFFALFPLILFAYFFFSYFLNHGQTPSMLLLKKRIEMKPNSFAEAFRWATHSFLLCLSWGTSYLLKPEVWKLLKSHDHLYYDLMAYKEVKVVNLVSLSEESHRSEETWQEAA
ncbi:MAG: hypothetical protein ACLGHN_03950 [Bacteriovoracia bacterium]